MKKKNNQSKMDAKTTSLYSAVKNFEDNLMSSAERTRLVAEEKIEEDKSYDGIISLIGCFAAMGRMHVTLDDTDYILTYDIARKLISEGYYVSGKAIYW